MKKCFLFFLLFSQIASAQKANDVTAPLHLMKPEYAVPYGAPTKEMVQSVLDRVYNYLDRTTPTGFVNRTTGNEVSLNAIDTNTTLKPGDFRLTSYEWGVTYSGMLEIAAATGDKKYVQYLNEEWAKTYQLLWDKDAHLYWRDASYIGKTEKNGQKLFWGRGNGWVMGGLARTLEYLPKDDPKRSFYETQLREMSASLAKIQGTDGLWRSGLLDAADYPEPELSGSDLITFGMAWGINNGVLDAKTYRPVVAKAWAGMLKHIYADGRLGDIQQTGAAPSTFKPSASYNYGVGGFLLAGSEMHKLAMGKAAKSGTSSK